MSENVEEIKPDVWRVNGKIIRTSCTNAPAAMSPTVTSQQRG